jgi:hypothetical protein
MPISGQGSGDFRENQGALRILYSVVKDSIGVLSADAFTQLNPNVVTTASAVSTTLPANVKRGVLGGSVAFTRPDQGSNIIGGAVVTAGPTFIVNTRPLGLFINDALGNANENTPGISSGKGPVLRSGGAGGVKIYETDVQTTFGGGVVGTALPAYAPGMFLYASVNGYLTSRWQDTYEAQWITAAGTGSGGVGAAIEPDVTRMGVVIAPPDASSTELFFELRV